MPIMMDEASAVSLEPACSPFPTPEEVRMAAYFRWQRRGWAHGQDLDDWAEAEQDLLFSRNFEVLARVVLDGEPARILGDPARRLCRFCEQAAPRASFSETPDPVVPGSLGNTTLLTYEQCDECRDLLAESLGGEFEAFRRRCVEGQMTPGCTLPIPAYKELARMALMLMPTAELDHVADTIEWVLNPDHDLDSHAFEGLGCYLHAPAVTPPAPWAALARRTRDDVPFPYLIFFVATPRWVFEAPVPLCIRDEDLEGGVLRLPRVATTDGLHQGIGGVRSLFLPLAAASPPARPQRFRLPL